MNDAYCKNHIPTFEWELIPEKVLFEYTKNSSTSYEALENADIPSGMIYIINKYQLE